MPYFKAFITASRRIESAQPGQQAEERKVFPVELEAASLLEAQRLVRQRFVQEHNTAGDDWLPEQVEVIPVEE